MALRALLILSVALQSLAGVARAGCPVPAEPTGDAPPAAGCGPVCCCAPPGAPVSRDGSGMRPAGPVACPCDAPAERQPMAPAPRPTAKPDYQPLALAPLLSPVVLPGPASAAGAIHGSHPVLHSTAHTIQSLLCVWLT